MYSQRKRRRIKPLARPTSFDLNVSFDIRHYQNVKFGQIIDPYFPAIATNEAFQVMEGELLMKFKPNQGATYRDHQMHVFSFANGLKADKGRRTPLNANNPDQPDLNQRLSILNKLSFAGVAVTGFKPDVDVFEQGFVATIGGLNTIFNNGQNTINAGDILAADLPKGVDKHNGPRKRALQGGIPIDKLQFVVRPFQDMLSDFGGADEADEAYNVVSNFIIGTALSYARPGDPVDIVLHRCNRFGWNATPATQVAVDGTGAVAVAASNESKSNTEFNPPTKKKKRTKRGKLPPTVSGDLLNL